MKKTVLMQPKLVNRRGAMRVIYNTDPYSASEGALRAMQRFAVIALTTRGTDSIRPWFGTLLPQFPLMNIGESSELILQARDELKDAIRQFFIIQAEEQDAVTEEDTIENIDIITVELRNTSNLYMEVMFYPVNADAITLSLVG